MQFWLGGLLVIIIVGCMWRYFRRKEIILLKRLERMIDEARDHHRRTRCVDESLVSAVELSLDRLISDMCVAEEELQKQKDKTQMMITDISHQTAAPISNILLYGQLLEEQIEDEGLNGSVGAVVEQAEKLEFLIESMIKASRLETGIIKTISETGDVSQLIRQVIVQAQPAAARKGIKLEYDEVKSEVIALFDFKWTAEALFNIIDNAVKYTPAGGRITISVIPYQMFVRIDIKDTGMGISETELPSIFGRFYRSPKVRNEKGVGLGLYLAREIISGEKGYIRVSSTEGKGTVFSVFLPEILLKNISKL